MSRGVSIEYYTERPIRNRDEGVSCGGTGSGTGGLCTSEPWWRDPNSSEALQ